MDGLFGVFLFLIFILAPLLEQLRKKQQGGGPPSRRTPAERPSSRVERSQTEEVSGRPREDATSMIPEELWQILTGESRPPVSTPPEPVGQRRTQPWDVVYIPPEEVEDEELETAEDVDVEVRRTWSYDEDTRRAPREAAQSLEIEPTIISLETPPPSSAQRHSSFHERLAGLAAPATVTPRRRRRSLGLGSRSELQRAVLLQEVLGPPRGLE